MMNRLLSLWLSFAIVLFSFPALAAPPEDVSLGTVGAGKVAALRRGQKAPFQGVLLDAEAAAKLMAEKDEQEAQCKIEIEKEVEKERAKGALKIENLRATNESLQKQMDERIALKDDHIQFLEKEAERNAKKAGNAKWWLVGGIAGGILLSIGAAFIVREVRNNGQPIIVNTQ